jgi:hypothetical protein
MSHCVDLLGLSLQDMLVSSLSLLGLLLLYASAIVCVRAWFCMLSS